MTIPLYTALTAAFLILLQVGLMISVGTHRLKGQFIGIGEDRDLERKVRRHGNLAENAGLFVAALALLELIVGQTPTVLVLCLTFVVARIAHAVGFSSLAGSHGDDLAGARRLFAGARLIGAFGTLLAALGIAGAIAIAVL
ncbi:MAG: MAPEG family protein [Erythrobacter sp.]